MHSLVFTGYSEKQTAADVGGLITETIFIQSVRVPARLSIIPLGINESKTSLITPAARRHVTGGDVIGRMNE